MWKIKNVKKNGRKILRNNIWTLALIGIIMSLIVGEYTIGKNGFANWELLGEETEKVRKIVSSSNINVDSLKNIANIGEIENLKKREKREEIINEYFDKTISQLLFGNMTGVIESYNEKHNVTKGIFFTIFNIFTNGQTQVQNIAKSIADYSSKSHLAEFLLIITSIISLLIKILLTNPILVGESRIYLESINYKKTKFNRIVFPFRKKRYINIVRTILLMRIYKLLWNITIIGGLIKNYSYKMVTYIVAENPNIKPKDAIRMSREMMNGNKMHTFGLDASFIGWYLLEYITFGIFGLYVIPYTKATGTELYRTLREDYIKSKKYNYEALNDEKLYNKELAIEEYKANLLKAKNIDNKIDTTEKNELEEIKLDRYPDFKEKKLKIKIDYDKKYEITSIILFFFIFAFVGWLWEVGLFLFEKGVLINRGAMYGPWLPIYGVGCTVIILLTKFKVFRKMLKKPLITFMVIMIVCSTIEYLTSWYIEATKGVKYWDYTGIFFNLNGRICLESTLFFGIGGSLCVYIIAPLLEKLIQKLNKKVKIIVCIVLVIIFMFDAMYTSFNPHKGMGITEEIETTRRMKIKN